MATTETTAVLGTRGRDEMQPDPPPSAFGRGFRLRPWHYAGWTSLNFVNGFVTGAMVPGLAGRIMAFGLGPYQYIFTNWEAEPDPFNGATTDHPAEHFGGVELAVRGGSADSRAAADHEFDFGNDEAEAFFVTHGAAPGNPAVRLDQRAELRAGSSVLSVRVGLENIEKAPIETGLTVTMNLDSGRTEGGVSAGPNESCSVFIPLAHDDRCWTSTGNLSGVESKAPEGVLVGAGSGSGTLSARTSAGWIAFSDASRNNALCVRFPFEAGAAYPGGGETVTCSIAASTSDVPGDPVSNPDLLVVRLVGPDVRLEAGERSELEFEWGATRCHGPIVSVTDAGCTTKPLRAVTFGGARYIVISGSFGTFHEGSLFCHWFSHRGKSLHRRPLGNVSPFAPVVLDQVLELPGAAASIVLELQDSEGSLLGEFGRATIEDGE